MKVNDPPKDVDARKLTIIETEHRRFVYAESPAAGTFWIIDRYTGLIYKEIEGSAEDVLSIIKRLV